MNTEFLKTLVGENSPLYIEFLKTQPIMSDQMIRWGKVVWNAAQQVYLQEDTKDVT